MQQNKTYFDSHHHPIRQHIRYQGIHQSINRIDQNVYNDIFCYTYIRSYLQDILRQIKMCQMLVDMRRQKV